LHEDPVAANAEGHNELVIGRCDVACGATNCISTGPTRIAKSVTTGATRTAGATIWASSARTARTPGTTEIWCARGAGATNSGAPRRDQMDSMVDTRTARDKNTVVRQGDGGAVNGRNKDARPKIEGTV
jgi:hypothetical protein